MVFVEIILLIVASAFMVLSKNIVIKIISGVLILAYALVSKLLNYFKPKILLGLTATPERMDGKDVLEYFDGRISTEMRLGEAIEKKLLSTFQYFCVSDALDLSKLKWSKGGYDNKEITNLLTIDKINAKRRAELVLRSLYDYISDINEVIGLGFCVSIEHAKFMANYFFYKRKF